MATSARHSDKQLPTFWRKYSASMLWNNFTHIPFRQHSHITTKKLSYRWQTARHMRMLKFHAGLSRAALWWMTVIFSHLTPSMRRSSGAIGFIFGTEKLEWLGYNQVKVAWRSTQLFGHNTSMWQTHTQRDKQTDSHVTITKCRANSLRRAVKMRLQQ